MPSADSPAHRDVAGLTETDLDDESPGFPDRRHIDLSRDPTPGVPDHALPDGAERHPLIDMSRDPTPGVADHALPDEDEES